jgi:hypothetical protein
MTLNPIPLLNLIVLKRLTLFFTSVLYTKASIDQPFAIKSNETYMGSFNTSAKLPVKITLHNQFFTVYNSHLKHSKIFFITFVLDLKNSQGKKLLILLDNK